MSGNTASSFGVRQLAAAFLHSAALAAVLRTRKHPFCNHLLTKCKFHKSFILTFMQNARGCRGILNFATPKPFALSAFCIHPLCFDTLAHSFGFFCIFLHLRKTQPVSFQPILHSLPQTPGVGYPLRNPCQKFRTGRTGVLFASLEDSFTECPIFRP